MRVAAKERLPEAVFTVTSGRQAKALEHPRSRQILLTLAKGEATLNELAGSLGLSLSLLHYHVARLRKLRLVEVVREQRRAGRSIKTYRTVARGFFVPTDKSSRSAGKALMTELREALLREHLRRPHTGTAYRIDATGRPKIERVASHGGASFEAWFRLSLDARTAESLARDLRSVFSRYSSSNGRAGAKRFLVYCGMAERAAAT